MGKVIGILLIVLGVWFATQFAAGTSPFQTASEDGEPRSLVSRTGSKVQSALDEGSARVDSMLEGLQD